MSSPRNSAFRWPRLGSGPKGSKTWSCAICSVVVVRPFPTRQRRSGPPPARWRMRSRTSLAARLQDVDGDAIGGLKILLEALMRGEADEGAIEHHVAFLLRVRGDLIPLVLGARGWRRGENGGAGRQPQHGRATRNERASERSSEYTSLLRGLLAGRGPAHRGLQLLLIGVKPVDPFVGIERSGPAPSRRCRHRRRQAARCPPPRDHAPP